MLKTASALLAAVALSCGLGALALGSANRASLVLWAGTLFFGWLSAVARPLGEELSSALAFILRGQR